MEIHTSARVSLSKKVSEDAMVVNSEINVYGVFDGATPISPFKNADGMNGAYIASNLFSKYFKNHFRAEMPLSEGIILANRRLMEEMKLNNIDINRPEELWSTCVAIIKIEKNSLSFAQLGDCMILAEYHNGEIKILTKDTVKDISSRAKIRREKDRKKGLILPDESYYQSIKNQLIYNRSMANTVNGYTVANGTEAVGNYIQLGSIDLNNLKSILLISDGLFHPKFDLIYTFKVMKEIGLEEYSKRLEMEELKSKFYSDDKTGIMIRF
ncbi:protein phosphatase 2C domain-containing protein [Bacillus sp. AFS055030]|uniref:protein phosphatase 2C domain-containing protein n=1 Tax=Bacillus sp. AFS055030 TaxID=2033507 RepID=UPI000BFD7BAE|nr:protein phosphatase 2C domain-containing protein [Bacillus sp. AFS055030]PGL73136.1 serine/threonine protein phosphatase [Bacillus sp. AFS055030]